MSLKLEKFDQSIPALKVSQWLNSWNDIPWDEKQRQAKPEPCFYLFSLSASELKNLTGVYRRKAQGPRHKDDRVQRAHDRERSEKIREFVKFGFPWCDMSQLKRESPDYNDLRKPGWLPTAIVVNILKPGDHNIDKRDVIRIDDNGSSGIVKIIMPDGYKAGDWKSNSVPPLEVIDGQHRLWAFDNYTPDGNFDLPVVAFYGLDKSWQAYLFWSINVSPKRINRSLAFDLYPLLRRETWLEKYYGHSIYRETRAQELVEALWSYEGSPWYQHINMLGEKNLPKMVSQASWVRSISGTFLRPWGGSVKASGGLFGASIGEDEEVLPWSRAQQAAFLIKVGMIINHAVKNSHDEWCTELRKEGQDSLFEKDPAFYGKNSLLNSDQGIRGLLSIVNDMCFVMAEKLDLFSWKMDSSSATNIEEVSSALKELDKLNKLLKYLNSILIPLSKFDWRSSSTPSLNSKQKLRQAAFRGSGGYSMLRLELLTHLQDTVTDDLAAKAVNILS